MHSSFVAALLAVSGGSLVSAAPQTTALQPPLPQLPGSTDRFIHAPPLSLPKFETKKFIKPITMAEIAEGLQRSVGLTVEVIVGSTKQTVGELISSLMEGGGGRNRKQMSPTPTEHLDSSNSSNTHDQRLSARAQCANPRIRREWDSYPATDRRAFTDAIKCLMTKPPSGQFTASGSRYEDMVALHQILTPNVHGNHKFLLWHRYYLWTFEQLLRTECGFNRELPWFDETRYAGRFPDSSIFSADNFGSVDIGGACVTNGQFANLAINIGPGVGNTRHCLARNGDGGVTANTNSQMVDGCNAYTTFSDMAWCAERGAHAYGHNGIGAVMLDTYASPSDPVFWLHHAFIDRNFRIWQNQNSARVSTIDGTDTVGNKLTLDSKINVYGIRPDVRIRDILDTTEQTLCYKYNY